MASYSIATEAAKWVAQEWAPEIDVLAYNKAGVYPLFRRLPRPLQTLHIPFLGNFAPTKPGDSGDLSSLTFISNTESEATFTPATVVTPVQVNLNTIRRMMVDPEDFIKEGIEKSLAQQVDTDALALAQTAVATNLAGDGTGHYEIGIVTDAIQKLAQSAKEYAVPGKGTERYMIVPNSEIKYALSISPFMQAYVRGDNEKPTVEGWYLDALGCRWYPSGVTAVSGNTAYGFLFIERGWGIGWNQDITMLAQPFQLVIRLIGWGDYAVGAIREQYGVALKVSAT